MSTPAHSTSGRQIRQQTLHNAQVAQRGRSRRPNTLNDDTSSVSIQQSETAAAAARARAGAAPAQQPQQQQQQHQPVRPWRFSHAAQQPPPATSPRRRAPTAAQGNRENDISAAGKGVCSAALQPSQLLVLACRRSSQQPAGGMSIESWCRSLAVARSLNQGAVCRACVACTCVPLADSSSLCLVAGG